MNKAALIINLKHQILVSFNMLNEWKYVSFQSYDVGDDLFIILQNLFNDFM